MRVVQIEPGPMPTLTASAPASASASAAAPVAMLPPMTSTFGKFFLTHLTRSMTPWLWPWAVSTTMASTPALASASTRSSVPSPTPTAAATRSLPWESRAALGKVFCLVMSLTVNSPRSSKASLTTSTRSSLWRCISSLATASDVPSGTVMSLSCGVMISRTGASMRVSKRRSRLVTMPTTRPLSTTGKPDTPCSFDSSTTSRTRAPGAIVTGSRSRPDS